MAGQIIPRGEGTWLVRVYVGRDPITGKRCYKNETVHGNKKEAERIRTGMLHDRNSGKLAAGSGVATVDVLLDGLLRDYKVNGKSYSWVEQTTRRHLRTPFGKVKASKITTEHLKTYVANRQSDGAANATINRELALLRRAFYLGLESKPPLVLDVPKFPMLKENNVRKGFFEHEAYLAIREELPPDIKPVLAFAYWTGCRKGEILKLQWRQVDLLERVIRFDAGQRKNDEPSIIPMAPELYEAIAMQKSVRDAKYPACQWVFFREGKPVKDFRDAWEKACRAAGFWEGDDETGHPTKLFHDLRRTGVRNLVRAGVPEKVAMAISGHKTRAVFDRYNIVDERDLKDAARKLGEYLGNRHTIGTQGEKQEPKSTGGTIN